MSLVAYEGSSDEEDGDNEGQEDGGGKVILVAKTQAAKTSNGGSSDSVTFAKLPQPLDLGTVEEVQDEFLKKKEQPAEKPSKPPVKITLPSMSQFDSDDEDAAPINTPKTVNKASGLFALLPAPKGTPLSNKSFIPQVLTKKPAQVAVKPKKKEQPKPVQLVPDEDSDDSDVDMDDLPETFDEETWKKVCAPTKKPQKRTIEESQEQGTSSAIEIAPEAPKPYDGLDNEAFKQLVGSSKRRRENIKLIDINEEEVTPDKDLWITKSLTDPEMVPKQQEEEDDDAVNNTQRRKHHITYLAQQAKANEQELQTQWASNKYKKSLTRSKYGF